MGWAQAHQFLHGQGRRLFRGFWKEATILFKKNLNILSSVQTYFQMYLGLRFVSLHASAGYEVNNSWKEELPYLFLIVSAPKDRKGFQCLKTLFFKAQTNVLEWDDASNIGSFHQLRQITQSSLKQIPSSVLRVFKVIFLAKFYFLFYRVLIGL